MSFPNRYQSVCFRCGKIVPVGEGVCVKQEDGWGVRHKGRKCPQNAATPAPSTPPKVETVLITGNTYPVKDQLRDLGGRWDGSAKGWRVPADRAAEARALVSAAPKKTRERKPRQPRLVGERSSTLASEFTGSKHDREPHRKVGDTCWLRHAGKRIACVVIGYERASWVSGDMLEDMGNYSHGGYGAWIGHIYYRKATRDEALALAEREPREDGVIPEE